MVDTFKLYEAMINGDKEYCIGLVNNELLKGSKATNIVESFSSAMNIVGEKFTKTEIYLPEMLVAGLVMQSAVEALEENLSKEGSKEPLGTFVIGTVQGDLHDIGKSIVAMMFKAVGFNVIDLGYDVAPKLFVESIKKHKADIVGMSTLLTTTVSKIGETIDEIKNAGLRDDVKILIGGPPLTDEDSVRFGADGYAPEVGSAIILAKELLKS